MIERRLDPLAQLDRLAVDRLDPLGARARGQHQGRPQRDQILEPPAGCRRFRQPRRLLQPVLEVAHRLDMGRAAIACRPACSQ